MKNLLVTIGKHELPDSYTEKLEDTLVLHTKLEDSDLVKSITSLYEPGIIKCNLEFEAKELFDRVIFVNTDFFNPNKDISKLFSEKLEDFKLYTLDSTVKFINHKDLIFPSVKLWACSSLTFNILSNLREKHFKRTNVYRYVEDSNEDLGLEHEFFNILGGFMIDIRAL